MRSFFGFCVVFFSVCVLFVSMFVPVSFSAQPPIDTTRFCEGTIGWGPFRADPARAYDTASGKLIFNVYENLIAWNRELYCDFVPTLATNVPNRTDVTLTITNTSAVGTDPADSTWTDGANSYTSMGYFDYNSLSPGFGQGDVIYMFDGAAYRTWFTENLSGTSNITLNLWRGSYTFNIRTNPTIYFWNETGAAVDTFDVDDAEYSFKRGLCQDIGPQWMFYRAFFGTMNSDPWDVDNTSRMQLAHLIDNAIEKNETNLVLNLGIPFPDNAFKQILASTWGSIVSEEFSISIGCWDGNLLNANSLGDPDWWNSSYVRRRSRSPYDTTGAYRYVGTGPYYVSVFNQAGNQVVMQRNTGWWQGWPIPGNGNPYSIGYVDTYEIDYIEDWTTRKNAFLSGAFDSCGVPRNNMFELLQAPNTNAEPILIGGKPVLKTIKNLQPSLNLDAFQFTFSLNASSPYVGSGHFPDGIPLNFFNNTHVRKAFAYSFNQTYFVEQCLYGEGVRQYTPLIEGLCPDYRNITSGYDANYALAEAELKQAMFDGQSVWDTGFTTTLYYWNPGGIDRIMVEIIRFLLLGP